MSSRATATSRIPADIGCVLIGAWIGGTSGLRGVMLAPAPGGLLPGGPMVSFSRALAVWQMGAGQAQLIAFLAAWSAFAVYRIISYELPLISPGFCSSSHPIGCCCRLSQDSLPQLFLS